MLVLLSARWFPYFTPSFGHDDDNDDEANGHELSYLFKFICICVELCLYIDIYIYIWRCRLDVRIQKVIYASGLHTYGRPHLNKRTPPPTPSTFLPIALHKSSNGTYTRRYRVVIIYSSENRLRLIEMCNAHIRIVVMRSVLRRRLFECERPPIPIAEGLYIYSQIWNWLIQHTY